MCGGGRANNVGNRPLSANVSYITVYTCSSDIAKILITKSFYTPDVRFRVVMRVPSNDRPRPLFAGLLLGQTIGFRRRHVLNDGLNVNDKRQIIIIVILVILVISFLLL